MRMEADAGTAVARARAWSMPETGTGRPTFAGAVLDLEEAVGRGQKEGVDGSP